MNAKLPIPEFPSILAHHGGWDEILMIVGPLAVVGGALWLANKRANQLDQSQHSAQRPGSLDLDGPDKLSNTGQNPSSTTPER